MSGKGNAQKPRQAAPEPGVCRWQTWGERQANHPTPKPGAKVTLRNELHNNRHLRLRVSVLGEGGVWQTQAAFAGWLETATDRRS